MNPRFPIYVISKGRPNTCLTARELDLMSVPYTLVIEPKEVSLYSKNFDSNNILVTPFEDLNEGSIPVRNFVWGQAEKLGFEKHWVLDDNIEGFHRLNRNIKPKVTSGTIFKCAEDFVDRYENIMLSGFNYYSFCKTTDKIPAYYKNTRIYSCILVDHRIPYKWRGRFNEDTDLSLRVLKDGYCTVLFNAFLAGKVTTMRMKGGNTDTVYATDDNRLEFAESLKKQHPDIVRVVKKFGRYHHQVNYKPFKKNKLIKKEGIVVPKGVNNYGMTLLEVENDQPC